jgi:ribosome biogenesis GTPase / thiamine phosphate phosphatase
MELSAARARAPRDTTAVVVRVDFRACVLRLADGETLEATVRGAMMGQKKSLGNVIVVGDQVSWTEEEGDRPVITEVSPRRNSFSRRASGDRPEEQVMAANLDQVVVVTSIRNPAFSPGFVDRVLAQAEHAGLPARIVLNKVDLGGHDEADTILADYGRAGYAGLVTSAKTRHDVDRLRHVCRGRRSLFVGHSGVGKSTLLNALVPELELVSGAVNAKTGKGRHTTTAAWMLVPEPGFEVIDTPGMRSFGLWGVGARDLEQAYPEFRRVLGECRFSDCHHDREPGCALRDGVERGEIAARRFESFLKLRDELARETADEPSRGRGRT